MKLSNYSLSHSRLLAGAKLDLFRFLEECREMGLEGASLHVDDLPGTSREELARVRRAYLDQGLSVSMVAVSTDFGAAGKVNQELERARQAVRVAAFLGAPLLRVFAGSPPPGSAGKKRSRGRPRRCGGSAGRRRRRACRWASRTTTTGPSAAPAGRSCGSSRRWTTRT